MGSWPLWPWPLTLDLDLFHAHHASVNGNNSWKFHDDTMRGTLSKRCDKRTDGRTDRQAERSVLGAAWSQLTMMMIIVIMIMAIVMVIIYMFAEMYDTLACHWGPPRDDHHDDVIKWKHVPRYWPFVRGFHRSPVPRSFDVSLDLRLNKQLSRQWCGWWFETPSRPSLRHCNVVRMTGSWKI